MNRGRVDDPAGARRDPPVKIDARKYPQLSALVWSRADPWVTEAEALSLYEANRRWIDPATMTPDERELFDRVVRDHGAGVFLG